MRCRAGIDKEDFPVRYSIRFRNPSRIPGGVSSLLPLFSSSSLPRDRQTLEDRIRDIILPCPRFVRGAPRFHDRIPPSSPPVQYKTPSSPLFLTLPFSSFFLPCNPQNIQMHPCCLRTEGKENESKKKKKKNHDNARKETSRCR